MINRLINQIIRIEVTLIASSARLQARSDDEALHDLRVAVRRLRSILRLLRGLPAMDRLEAAAAEVGKFSTPLRDREVLIQHLELHNQTDLSAAYKAELEKGRDALLISPELEKLQRLLEVWPAQVRQSQREGLLKNLSQHISQRLKKEQRRLGKALRDPAHDRHRLRILIKRVRYAAEAYPQQANLSANTLAKLKKAQGALGTWHDSFQWLAQAEKNRDLQPLRETWQETFIDAEKRSDKTLKPLARAFRQL